MTKQEAEFIKSAIEAGGESADIIENYKGKFEPKRAPSYAVVFDSFPLIIPLLIEYAFERGGGPGLKIPDFGLLRSDEAGHGFVLY